MIDAIFQDVWNPVITDGNEDHPVRALIGDTVVTYLGKDDITSVSTISSTLPGYPEDHVDAFLLEPGDEATGESHKLHIFHGKEPKSVAFTTFCIYILFLNSLSITFDC